MFAIGYFAGNFSRTDDPLEATAPPSPPRPTADTLATPTFKEAAVAPPADPAPSAATAGSADKRKKSSKSDSAVGRTATDGPSERAKSTEVASSSEESDTPQDAKAFNTKAANRAMRSALRGAIACRKAEDPAGEGQITLTFAPSGKVTSSTLSGAPYEGTQIGNCIASAFLSIRVPAFTGDPVTVTNTLTLQ